MEPTKTLRRKGPIPGPPTKPYTLMLEPETADWAKSQPGGLSELVRRYLHEAYRTHNEKHGHLSNRD